MTVTITYSTHHVGWGVTVTVDDYESANIPTFIFFIFIFISSFEVFINSPTSIHPNLEPIGKANTFSGANIYLLIPLFYSIVGSVQVKL